MTARSRPGISMIWAQAQGGVIGDGGGIPWRLPEDLAHFKQLTLGSPVIMGRATWDSLPPRFRPLEGRRNIVVTRQAEWSAEGADAAASVDQALALADGPAWIIGGGALYAEVLPRADRLEVTEVNLTVDGDTHAPSIGDDWAITATDPATGWHTSRTGIEYRFLTYLPATTG